MRIIEQRDEVIVTCTSCNSVFAFESGDVRERDRGPTSIFVKCPVCDTSINLTWQDIPKRWYDRFD